MTVLWWHWLVLSLFLVLVELGAAGGFYIIFFGVGAMLVGVLAAFGAAGPPWMQLLLFSVLSVVSLLLFRTRLLRAFQADQQRPAVDPLVGEVGVVIDELAPGAVGRIELRGTTWSARNAAPRALVRGSRCRVVWVDGLTLHVEPEGAHA
jgi:membrane protein implicated in regulation of membrane protease activity